MKNIKYTLVIIAFVLAVFSLFAITDNKAYACNTGCTYPPITGACTASVSTANIGDTVTYSVTSSGGNGYFVYSWTGTNGLSSLSNQVSKSYSTSGTKFATVTITSNNQSIQKTCSVVINQPVQNNLVVSCYANPTSVNINSQISWTATVSGGNGNYNYSWTGSNRLSGSSQTVSQTYNVAGSQNATVTVTSNGQTQSATCNAVVNNNNQSNLTAYCSVSPQYANINDQVIWTVNATGGNGNYNYSWTGTDGLYGYSSTLYHNYNTPGTKYGTVTVTSNGQSITQTCSTNIQGNNYNNNITAYCEGIQSNYGNNNSYVTWRVYPSGLNNNNYNNNNSYYNGYYTYSWTGTDGLYGSDSTVTKTYSTPGTKYATVVVYGNGQQVTASCNVNVNVQNQQTSVYLYTPPTPPAPTGGVYLNSIPATGISPTLKTTLFLAGLFTWSAFLAYLYIARRNEKIKAKKILESIK